MRRRHRMPFGAQLDGSGGARFRLWAPTAAEVILGLEGPGPRREIPLLAGNAGWFEADVPEVEPGARYRFRVRPDRWVPDPASRFQPEGVHGPSELVDPLAFHWQDDDWRGRPWPTAAIYELHVGTFTPEGTFSGVEARLDHLERLGVTVLELMPVSESPGRFGWGYDGVYPFAPESRYGRPEDLKSLVQAAHQRGLMVMLDVVYNHFGPEGSYLAEVAPDFFTKRFATPWGAAIDFAGPRSRTVRDYFVHNALYWLEEYHFDGLRLDAVHAIHDESDLHILYELSAAVRAANPEHEVHLVLENDRNQARHLERAPDGSPRAYVAQWNDDIHHVLHVLLTGEREGYYGDYQEDPIARLGRCLTQGFDYQGEASAHARGAPRGEPSDHLPPDAFVNFLQNHDQVGNRPLGDRITQIADAAGIRAAVTLLLLAPSPPLLFMGEEWAASRPFPFFCDLGPHLADSVREGRRREFAAFPGFQDAEARERIPDPNAPGTFQSGQLPWEEIGKSPHRETLALYRQLLHLRQQEIAPRLAGTAARQSRFERIGAHALHVRWRLGDGAVLSAIVQLAPEAGAAEPARPAGRLLHATHPDAEQAVASGRLPPWFVAWFLEPRAEEEA